MSKKIKGSDDVVIIVSSGMPDALRNLWIEHLQYAPTVTRINYLFQEANKFWEFPDVKELSELHTQRAIAATEILLELANYEVKMHKLQEACDVLTDIPSNHESIINARLYLRDVQDLVCAPRIRDLQERLNELHLV